MNFGLLGASKTGTSIAYHLWKNGYSPKFLWNRTVSNLDKTQNFVPFEIATDKIDKYENNCDFLIISVSDDFIEKVISDFCNSNDVGKLKIFHTSGALDSQILQIANNYNCKIGSFHPVISIQNIEDGIKNIPNTIFTCEGEIAEDLKLIAQKIAKDGIILSPVQKQSIHLSAVFMNNYLSGMIEKIKLMNKEIGISEKENQLILQEITKQTISRSWLNPIDETLTGPIKRGDINTIEKHLEMLKDDELFQQLYKKFGNIILKFVNHDIYTTKNIEKMLK